jgi:hypothetical protein
MWWRLVGSAVEIKRRAPSHGPNGGMVDGKYGGGAVSLGGVVAIARRFRDVIAAVVSDLGGAANITETRLARGAPCCLIEHIARYG